MNNLKFTKAVKTTGKKVLVTAACVAVIYFSVPSAISDFQSIEPVKSEYYFQGYQLLINDTDDIININDDGSYALEYVDGYVVTLSKEELDGYKEGRTYPELDGKHRLIVTKHTDHLNHFYKTMGKNIIPGVVKIGVAGVAAVIGGRQLTKKTR